MEFTLAFPLNRKDSHTRMHCCGHQGGDVLNNLEEGQKVIFLTLNMIFCWHAGQYLSHMTLTVSSRTTVQGSQGP